MTAITLPNPNVSCDTRSPTFKTIVEEALRPVALGAGVKCDVFKILARDGADACSFHSITSSGISARKRDAGL